MTDLLQSLGRLTFLGQAVPPDIRIIVVDNDAERSAAATRRWPWVARTRRPGTTISFTSVLPASCSAIFASSFAAARTAALIAHAVFIAMISLKRTNL